jgi:2-keto-4-pentenoate hydratase/2-oxohepta-3-ene-1,7-dioic acid hydratase in catechol pathway
MRFCRYVAKEGTRYGVVEAVDGVDQITRELPGPQLQVSEAGVPQQIVMPEASAGTPLEKPIALDAAKLLIPLPIVSKILCVGRNYLDHVKEMNHDLPAEPVIFSKPPSSLLAYGGTIVRPRISERVDHEGELGVVIGRTCRHLKDDDNAADYILGYTCINDVTARDLQKKDSQWTRAKGFDTFCPVGPVIATTGLDPRKGVTVETRVNGELKQSGDTFDFIFTLDYILRYLSQFCTLLPGDIVATGTPAGVSPLAAGDTVEVTVQGVGTLRNRVADE